MIVFCVTCRGRNQHIRLTLPKNIVDNADFRDCKFVLLDYGSPDDLISYVLTHHMRSILAGRLVLYRFPDQKGFKMAHAKNMAHRLGILEGGDILVNLDADNYTGPGFAKYVAEKFAADPNVFLWANRNQPSEIRYPKGCNGRIAVSKHAFVNAGGYNEGKYETWGPDDKDFNFRLRRLGYTPAEIPRQFLEVVLHNDKMRFRDYPHAKNGGSNCDDEIVEGNETIANFGNFGCGTVYRNFDPSPIELRPVPTRVFGIGMHKTATTSLHHALKILGYDSAHWKSAHWAKAIWREMNTLGRSLTLEKSYALCDLPITLLYQKLDRAYPGSKFILTKRSEDGWIETVRKHWDPAFNPFRGQWDGDPFTNRIHTILYGSPEFNADKMLARYRSHNAAVLDYFKGRRDDLLVMDMDFGWPNQNDAGAGWWELCSFLGDRIPLGVPYPRAFASY